MSAEGGDSAAPTYDEYEAYQDEIEANEEEQTPNEGEGTTEDGPATKEVDLRSVYVGNVDYSTTAEQLNEHFQSCGELNKITIPVDKFTGSRKGFAYLEFADAASVAKAVELTDSTLNGRAIKVTAKRTNVPAFIRGGRGGARGAPPTLRGGFRGGRGGMMPNPKMMLTMMNAMQMAMRGGRGGGRGGSRGRGGPPSRGGSRGGRGGSSAPSGTHSAPY